MFGTASAEVWTWSREEPERRPGRLFTLHIDPMGLDLIPVRCQCGRHTYERDIQDACVHRETDLCPFQDERFPRGILGGCCWLLGKIAEIELEALGETALRERMFEDMTAEEAVSFGRALAGTADFHEELPEEERFYKHETFAWKGTWDRERYAWVFDRPSTFEQAIVSVREAARWYEKVGRLGFGVRAWW